MNERREGVPGTGLPLVPYLAILLAATGVFLFYNGALWSASRESSHVARFAVSYAVVIPLAAAILAGLHRFTWSRLVTTTGSTWAFKLVLTAVLYLAFARGTATRFDAAVRVPRKAVVPLHSDYQPAMGEFASGTLHGTVRRKGGAAAAIVVLDSPSPGRAPPEPSVVDLVIQHYAYEKPVYIVRTHDEVRVANRDSVLHTVRISGDGGVASNRPTPASSAPRPLSLPEPGFYQIRCDNHPAEVTWLVVTDHPYVTQADAQGSFELAEVPAGSAHVVALFPNARGGRLAEGQTTVVAGGIAQVLIDFEAGREVSPRGLRTGDASSRRPRGGAPLRGL